MTLNKADSRRVLKEFHRWQNVSNMLDVDFNADYILSVNEPPKHLAELKDWRRVSGQQVNRVKVTVNAIDDKRLRKILIRRYLIRRKVSAQEVMAEVGLRKSRYYELLNEAIECFGVCYKD